MTMSRPWGRPWSVAVGLPALDGVVGELELALVDSQPLGELGHAQLEREQPFQQHLPAELERFGERAVAPPDIGLERLVGQRRAEPAGDDRRALLREDPVARHGEKSLIDVVEHQAHVAVALSELARPRLYALLERAVQSLQVLVRPVELLQHLVEGAAEDADLVVGRDGDALVSPPVRDRRGHLGEVGERSRDARRDAADDRDARSVAATPSISSSPSVSSSVRRNSRRASFSAR